MSEDILKMNLGPQLGELFVLAFMQATTHKSRVARPGETNLYDVNINGDGY